MTTKLIYSILSILMVIGTPIVFYGYLRKIRNIKPGFWNIIVGIILEFLTKDVLLGLIISLLTYIPSLNIIFTNEIMYGICTIVLTVILLTSGLLLTARLYYHGKISVDQASGLALGATISDLLMNFLMAAVSNLLYIHQLSNGTLLDNLLKTVSSEQALAVIKTYNDLPESYFLYIGVITVATLCGNYLITMIFSQNTNKKKSNFITLLLIITIITTVFYFINPITFTYANLSLILFIGLFFGFADMHCKNKLTYERSGDNYG